VHHRRADHQPRYQDLAGELARQAGDHAFRRRFHQAADGQHLGHQHGHRFQRLDLVGVVAARGAVLDGQHAQGLSGTADRHRQHGGKGLLAGFRAIGESGMVLRVRQVEHGVGRRRQADDALAHAQPGPPDGAVLQALAGGQLQHVARAHDIDRANLAHQLAGNEAHQLGQRQGATGQQVAQSGQQAAWRGHGSLYLPAGAETRPNRTGVAAFNK